MATDFNYEKTNEQLNAELAADYERYFTDEVVKIREAAMEMDRKMLKAIPDEDLSRLCNLLVEEGQRRDVVKVMLYNPLGGNYTDTLNNEKIKVRFFVKLAAEKPTWFSKLKRRFKK